jgi:hypothetical protein
MTATDLLALGKHPHRVGLPFVFFSNLFNFIILNLIILPHSVKVLLSHSNNRGMWRLGSSNNL